MSNKRQTSLSPFKRWRAVIRFHLVSLPEALYLLRFQEKETIISLTHCLQWQCTPLNKVPQFQGPLLFIPPPPPWCLVWEDLNNLLILVNIIVQSRQTDVIIYTWGPDVRESCKEWMSWQMAILCPVLNHSPDGKWIDLGSIGGIKSSIQWKSLLH